MLPIDFGRFMLPIGRAMSPRSIIEERVVEAGTKRWLAGADAAGLGTHQSFLMELSG